MKYHALFVIFAKAAKFEIVVCCNYRWRFKGYFWKSCLLFNLNINKGQDLTPADKFLDLIFRNNFFVFNFSKMCSL